MKINLRKNQKLIMADLQWKLEVLRLPHHPLGRDQALILVKHIQNQSDHVSLKILSV